ncbi:hypothetical protein [Spirosoma spitsbergense]|uniref:hypothetical protein n=1 Tax=Spirosoma spitsbergense TaxID=431554 RepID=UPI00037641DA|nr:hypothetical protein [Spirosoma spitsbergense]
MELLNQDNTLLDQYNEFFSENQIDSLDLSIYSEFSLDDLKKKILELQRQYFLKAPIYKIKKYPPLEWHPYIDITRHVDLSKPNLVLGTFPPPSYLRTFYRKKDKCEKVALMLRDAIGLLEPELYYFYGNKKSFWKVLGDLLEIKIGINLEVDELTEKLEKRGISITDIILALQRKKLNNKSNDEESDSGMGNSSDDSILRNIIPNYPLINALISESDNNVNRILFTSGSWNLTKRGKISAGNSTISLFFKLVLEKELSLYFAEYNTPFLQLNSSNYSSLINFCDKIVFNIKLVCGNKEKEYLIIKLPSPSTSSNRKICQSTFFKKWVFVTYGKKAFYELAQIQKTKDKFNGIKETSKINKKQYDNYKVNKELVKYLSESKRRNEALDIIDEYKKDIYNKSFSQVEKDLHYLLHIQEVKLPEIA